MKPEDKLCKNGCMFATKMPTMGSFKYEGETAEQSFLWRCTKIDHIVTIDSIFHKVGCGSFMLPADAVAEGVKVPSADAQAEALVAEVEQKIGEMAKENPAIAYAVTKDAEQPAQPATETPMPVQVPKTEEHTAVTTEKVTEGFPVHQMEVVGHAPLIDIAKPIPQESQQDSPKKRHRRTKAEMEAARAAETAESAVVEEKAVEQTEPKRSE